MTKGFTDAELDEAIDRLSEKGAFSDAETVIARSAPQLQRVLDSALAEGGYFGSSQESETLKAATTPDPDERITALRTLLAEEARMGMMVGVAVGWALHRELFDTDRVGDGQGKPETETEGET